MSRSVIGLQVVKPGTRADEVLAALAMGLHRGTVRPDSNGLAQVGLDMESEAAHAKVLSALVDTGADWQKYVTIAEREAAGGIDGAEECPPPRRSAVPRPRNRQR